MSKDLSSIGFICQTLQRPPGAVRKAIETLGIQPSMVINCVAHFDDSQVEAIRQHLARSSRINPLAASLLQGPRPMV